MAWPHSIHTFLPCASSHPSLIRASPHPPIYLGCTYPFQQRVFCPPDNIILTLDIILNIFGTIFKLVTLKFFLNLISDKSCRYLTMAKMLNIKTFMFSCDYLDFEVVLLSATDIGCIQTLGTSPFSVYLMIIHDLSDLVTVYLKFSWVASVWHATLSCFFLGNITPTSIWRSVSIDQSYYKLVKNEVGKPNLIMYLHSGSEFT